MTIYQFLSIIGVQALSAFIINFLLNKFIVVRSEKTQKDGSIKDAILCLLRNSLLDLYYKASEKGFANLADRENFDMMYKSYISLDGNGVIKEAYKRFAELPEKPNHPARRRTDKEVWENESDKE